MSWRYFLGPHLSLPILVQLWKQLSAEEREPYEAKNKEDVARYQRELAEQTKARKPTSKSAPAKNVKVGYRGRCFSQCGLMRTPLQSAETVLSDDSDVEPEE